MTGARVRLRLGDAGRVLAGMPGESVQCVVTSPPYYGLRDYRHPGQLGMEATPTEYVENLRKVFAELRRVLRPDGVAWLVIGDCYAGRANAGPSFDRSRGHGHRPGVAAPQINLTRFAPYKSLLGMPWRVAFALMEDGWAVRNEVVWNKTNAMPSSVRDRLANRHEQVFLLTRSARYYFDLDAIMVPTTGRASGKSAGAQSAYTAGIGELTNARLAGPNETSTLGGQHTRPGRNPGDVWSIGTSPYRGAHFATFPPKLAERCIRAGTRPGDVVLDPFVGSGTTCAVAALLGRPSIGIDSNPEFLTLAAERIHRPVKLEGEPYRAPDPQLPLEVE